MRTRRLFYEDAYIQEFEATVLSCEPEKDATSRVVLDQTAFYPEGGGQPADHGMLDDCRVLDVFYEEDEIIHRIEGTLTPGDSVHGVLDWNRRFDLMQQHSGEHLVSGRVHERFGYNNVGFHMGAEVITVDFDGMLDEEALALIEQEVNTYIWENHTSIIFYPDEEERAALPYRSKKELTGEVRLVHFPGGDLCACCGMHVLQSGEIGLAKLLSVKKFRDGVRVEMIFGRRAFDHLAIQDRENKKTAVLLSAKTEETSEAVKKLQTELYEQKGELMETWQRYFDLVAGLCAGRNQVALFARGLDATAIRKCTDAILDGVTGAAAVFSGSDASGYRYAIGIRQGSVQELVASLNQELSGRGGGKPGFAQGSLKADRASVEAYLTGKGFHVL